MEIQPTDFGANLNTWFRLLGRQWKPLLLVSLATFIPFAIIVAGGFLAIDLPGIMSQLSDPDLVESMTFDDLTGLVGPLVVAGLVLVVLQVVASVFVYLAANRISACHYVGIEPDWRAAARFAIGRLGRAIGAGLVVSVGALLIVGLVVATGLALISTLGTSFVSVFLTAVLVLTTFVLLFWLSFSLSLYSQSIAMTDKGAVAALKESFALVRQRWWTSVGFFLVTGLISAAAAQVLSIALVPLFLVGVVVPELLAVAYAAAVIFQGPVTAALAAAYSVWYIDLRARQERVETGELVR